MESPNSTSNLDARFASARDLFITPLVELLILAVAAIPVGMGIWLGGWGVATSLTVFYLSQVVVSLIALKVIRTAFSQFFSPGAFTVEKNRSRAYVAFNLYGFILITNLFLPHFLGWLPPPFRKSFYALLGARFGRGIISIGGKISDPHLVTIESDAIIGDGALLLGHAWNIVNGKDFLIFGNIVVGKRAVIGAGAVILPGVHIGEGAMVNAMSVVSTGTRIGPFEVWSGNPARRVSAPRENAKAA